MVIATAFSTLHMSPESAFYSMISCTNQPHNPNESRISESKMAPSARKNSVISSKRLIVSLFLSAILCTVIRFPFLWTDLFPTFNDTPSLPELQKIGKLAGNASHNIKFERYSEGAPSCHPINADNVSFTLVTQLSGDRMWQMEHHCERWGVISPISLAVLTNASYDHVKEELKFRGCNVSNMEVQVVNSSLYPKDDYPVNVLRNLALRGVQTSHVLYVDIDFWESVDLRDILHLHRVREALANDHKLALVIPAFVLRTKCRTGPKCRSQNIQSMPQKRASLKRFVKARLVKKMGSAGQSHGSTLYETWLENQTEPGSLVDIPCVYSNRYEPYLVFRYCREIPPFQEQFSGYGKNKISMIMHMIRMGYRLSQLGGGFLIHFPHPMSPSKKAWDEEPNITENEGNIDWSRYQRGRMDALFVEFKRWLENEVPDESVVPKCPSAGDDDWNLRLD